MQKQCKLRNQHILVNLKEKLKELNLPSYKETSNGLWARSNIDVVFKFFNKIKLEKFKHFVDLGSGDGSITILAAEFTNATGIEADKEFFKISKKLISKFNTRYKVNIINDDFYNVDLKKFDFIFINPDKSFNLKLERKLLNNTMKGAVIAIYNNIFLPRILKRDRTYWIDQIPIVTYKNEIKDKE